MREVNNKASEKVLEKLKSGKVSLNKAYVEMKGSEKENLKVVKKKIDSDSFVLGVKFALKQIAAGKTADEILAMKGGNNKLAANV